MNTEQHVERLVLEKQQLQNNIQGIVRILGMLADTHGKTTKGGKEYRITKSKMDAFNKNVGIRSLKTGALVISVTEPDDDSVS